MSRAKLSLIINNILANSQQLTANRMKEEDNIELRSDDVQEILGTPPSWIIRWGTLIAMGAILGLLILGWKLKFPDIISADLYLTTTNPPVRIYAKTDGDIKLFVKESEKVEQGEKLAIMQNREKYKDIEVLSIHMDSLSVMPDYLFNTYVPLEDIEIGELAEEYSVFLRNLKDYQFVNRQSLDRNDIQRVRVKVNNEEKSIAELKRLLDRAIKSLKEKKKWYQDLQEKYAKDIISLQFYRNAYGDVENAKAQVEKIKLDIGEKERNINALKMDESGIKQKSQTGSTKQLLELQHSVDNINRRIKQWEKTNVITAPIKGTVLLSDYYEPRKFLRKGDVFMAIQADDIEEVFAIATLKSEGASKVVVGQKVHIKLLSYNARDHGFLEGVLRSKTFQHKKGNYKLEIELLNGLVTSRDFDVPFEQGMGGVAEIITEEKNVLERIFSTLISIFSEN
ncbi:MAG TPA: hypothetical protein ENK52_01885 [Saprospiraceae bacterium]|nr:hypothetical protein [Saprospiraceae bacterium]